MCKMPYDPPPKAERDILYIPIFYKVQTYPVEIYGYKNTPKRVIVLESSHLEVDT